MDIGGLDKNKDSDNILLSNVPLDEIGLINPGVFNLRKRELSPSIRSLLSHSCSVLPPSSIEKYILYFGIDDIISKTNYHEMVFDFYVNIMTGDDAIRSIELMDSGADLTKLLRLGIIIKKDKIAIEAERILEYLSSDEWEAFKNEVIENCSGLLYSIEMGDGWGFISKIYDKYKTRRVTKLLSSYQGHLEQEIYRAQQHNNAQLKAISTMNSRSYGKEISNDIMAIMQSQGIITSRDDQVSTLKKNISSIFNATEPRPTNSQLDVIILNNLKNEHNQK